MWMLLDRSQGRASKRGSETASRLAPTEMMYAAHERLNEGASITASASARMMNPRWVASVKDNQLYSTGCEVSSTPKLIEYDVNCHHSRLIHSSQHREELNKRKSYVEWKAG